VLVHLFQGLALGLTAGASPGPFQAFLLAQAARGGWRRAWPAAFAPVLSDGPIVLLVLLLLTQVPAWLVSVLRMAGGAFLIYLAWGAWRAFRAPAAGSAAPRAGDAERGLWKAVAMNAISPGPYLFWSTVAGPAFLAGWNLGPERGIAFVAGFYGAMIAVSLALIAAFSAAAGLGPRVTRVLSAVSAVALAAFGLSQIGLGACGG
jgi:threonine/homoserine/homoserine lactone efflux protein